MPIERRRHPTPDPSEFANPRAEKSYWATERLLDKAPLTGELNMRYLYDNWNLLREEFLQKGESDDEATQIAWNTLAFFSSERLGDIIEQFSTDREEFLGNPPTTELGVIEAWNKMQGRHWDEKTESYIGVPFLKTASERQNQLELYDHLPAEVIDSENPESPLYGHIQLLDKIADKGPVTDELKSAVLAIMTNDRKFLGHEIDSWNRNLTMELPERVDEKSREYLLETIAGGLILTMAMSWGNEDSTPRHLELFDIYLDHFRQKPNPFRDFLSVEGFESKLKAWRKGRGEPETGEFREYHVPSSVLSEIKFKSSPKIVDTQNPSSYAIELDKYKGLKFGLLITWIPELQSWLGHSIISFQGNEPPRSIASPIKLLDIKSPTEALAGLIHYYHENLEEFRTHKSVTLTEEEKDEALKRLSTTEVRKLGQNSDPESKEKAAKSIKSLLKEIGDFRKFPPIINVAVQDLQTRIINWGILVNKDDVISAPAGINTLEDESEFIQLVDEMITDPTKLGRYDKVLVCSESVYLLVINDVKSKVISKSDRKSIVKRPGGLITIYRGRILL